MQHDSPPEDLLNLLHAMPNPVAVFIQSDGSLLAANSPFCKTLDLPEDERKQIVGNGSGDQISEPNPFCLDIISREFANFKSPSGVRTLADADVQPVTLDRKACWVVTPAGPNQQRDGMSGHYRALLENLNEIIYINDINANVFYVSPNIHRLTGYQAQEVIGKNFTTFVHPDDLEGRIDVFLKILAGEEQATEYRMITKTGEAKWVRTNARPVFLEGRVSGIQGVLMDVTDLKEAEEALRHSEEKYRNVVQNSKDAIFVIQGDHIKFMNPSACKVLGRRFDSIAHQPFLNFVHPDDHKMIMKRYSRRLAGESLSDTISFRLINVESEVKDVEVNAVLITWEEKPAVLNFLRDVTVQKKMETQLRNAHKMEALGTLSGGIAHNFNNLLMGIHGNGSLAMAEMNPSVTAYKHLEKIIGLVQSGSKLTRQLLEYARGKATEKGTVDVNQLVREATETLIATQKQIQIRFNLSADVPNIEADQGQIEQVLLNLLLNAADAMPDGGDVIIETACVKGAQAEGKVTLSNSMDYVKIKVSDSGTGIAPKVLHRIFEPFFTTKEMGSGTGLGLSTAYGIIKNHDGDIGVESQVGKGSTFFIYLPAIPACGSGPAENLDSPTIAGHGKILLVDDEPHVLHTSAALLEHLGFSVLKAISSQEGLDIFQGQWQNIDLVILDLILPKISGKELYYKFRQIDPRVKVFISSGYSQGDSAKELIANGCLAFIQKPYDMKDLSAMIMDAISTAGNHGRNTDGT